MAMVVGTGTGADAAAARDSLLRSQPLPVAGRFFAWLTDGMTDEDRAFLRRTVPSPVVTVLSRVFGRRHHKEIAPTWRRDARADRDGGAQLAGGRPLVAVSAGGRRWT